MSSDDGFARLLEIMMGTMAADGGLSSRGPRNTRINRNRRPPENAVRRVTARTFQQNPSLIREIISELNPNAFLFDDLDEALIGHSASDHLAIYEKNLIIGVFERRDGMTYEEASEHYEFNVLGLRGENMPIIVDLGWTGAEDSVSEEQQEKAVKQKKDKPKPVETQGVDPIQGLEL